MLPPNPLSKHRYIQPGHAAADDRRDRKFSKRCAGEIKRGSMASSTSVDDENSMKALDTGREKRPYAEGLSA